MSKERKVADCIYPDLHGCRGCEYNTVPEVFDGGCKLYLDRLKRESKTCQPYGINTTTINKERA